MSASPRVAVVGAGWAGLAAAVHAVGLGAQVTLYDMARQPGGRARSLRHDGQVVDNGQHILIGAYTATLALMRRVGVDPDAVLRRSPLALVGPDGQGLALPPGPPVSAFVRGVLAHRGWSWRARWALLAAAVRWRLARFQCPPGTSVAQLCATLPAAVRDGLVDPLCVAALNTPADQASGQVFLRVLQDALFSGPGGADLLLPRAPLADLLPEPALRWLAAHGAQVHLGHRVQQLRPADGGGTGWWVDGAQHTHVVLACAARESARLARTWQPDWAATCEALPHAAIATVWLRAPGLRLPQPMVALTGAAGDGPAQFVFDLGQLGGEQGLFAFVASAAQTGLGDGGLATVAAAVQAQAAHSVHHAFGQADALWHAAVEKRATFACTPGLQRPPAWLAPGLVAAGDHVAGPYPATLEGAVRSGQAAVAQALGGAMRSKPGVPPARWPADSLR